MIEADILLDSSPVEQGDVFAWNSTDVSPQLGIIVTADCDIANQKFGSHLSYVPAWTLEQYMFLFYWPAQLQKVRVKHLDKLVNDVHALQSRYKQHANQQLLSPSAVASLMDLGDAEIFEALGVPGEDSKSRASLGEAALLFRDLKTAIEDVEARTEVELIDLVCRQRKATQKSVEMDLKAHFAQLPGDRIFLSCVDGVAQSGYVVTVRHLREIEHDQIAVRPSELRTRAAKRIARVRAPFKYRITQLLADTFASIGLPGTYEARRAEIVQERYIGKGA